MEAVTFLEALVFPKKLHIAFVDIQYIELKSLKIYNIDD